MIEILSFVRIRDDQIAVYDRGKFSGIAAELSSGRWAYICENANGAVVVGVGDGLEETIHETRKAIRAGRGNN